MDIERGVDPREAFANWKAEPSVEQQATPEEVVSKVDITPEQFQRALELMTRQERFGKEWIGHIESDQTNEGGVNVFYIPESNTKALETMDQFLAKNGFTGSDNEHLFPVMNQYRKFLIENAGKYMYRVGAKKRTEAHGPAPEQQRPAA
jgi:hypothetical protein